MSQSFTVSFDADEFAYLAELVEYDLLIQKSAHERLRRVAPGRLRPNALRESADEIAVLATLLAKFDLPR